MYTCTCLWFDMSVFCVGECVCVGFFVITHKGIIKRAANPYLHALPNAIQIVWYIDTFECVFEWFVIICMPYFLCHTPYSILASVADFHGSGFIRYMCTSSSLELL
jgi:hypothetical protein